MFDPGTKIILIESSLHKTVGPRKGSIGYISNCYNTRTLQLMTEKFNSISVVASICEVMFIRFGFEERGRIERKTIISVIPILKRENQKKIKEEEATGVVECIANFRDMLNSPKSGYLWESIRDNFEVASSLPIVLATPVSYDPTDLATCDNIEFRAWITAHLTSSSMRRFVSKSLQSSHFTKYNDPELRSIQVWSDLDRMTGDRTQRGEYIRIWTENVDTKRKAITFIRKLLSAQCRYNMKQAMFSMDNLAFMGMQDHTVTMYDTIGPYLYNKIIVAIFTDICLKLNVPEITVAVEDLETTISTCLSLSDNMLKVNSGFGYTSSSYK